MSTVVMMEVEWESDWSTRRRMFVRMTFAVDYFVDGLANL